MVEIWKPEPEERRRQEADLDLLHGLTGVRWPKESRLGDGGVVRAVPERSRAMNPELSSHGAMLVTLAFGYLIHVIPSLRDAGEEDQAFALFMFLMLCAGLLFLQFAALIRRVATPRRR